MPDWGGILALLAVPVAALLFLNLRLSRRLRYPHQLLSGSVRRGAASFLLHRLRTYYDVLLDAAIALVLAFALADALGGAKDAGGAAAKGRVVAAIDCSRSMLAGFPGSRPLDLAARRLSSDPALKGAEPFALVFDPGTGGTRLLPVGRLLAGASPEEAARRLATELPFFAVDYSALSSAPRGRPLVLLTDRLGARPVGFRAIESGFAVEQVAWPTEARYDRSSESWIAVLAESGPRAPLAVSAWEAGRGAFAALAPSRYAIEDAPAGRTVRFPAPGLYLVSVKGFGGQPDADFPLRLAPRGTAAAASGPFSERMLSAFPLLEPSTRPSVVLADLPGPAARSTAPRVDSSLATRDGEFVLDPALSAGRPIAAAAPPAGPARPGAAASFALGPSSLANEDLVLAYDAVILGLSQGAYTLSAPRLTAPLVPAGESWLARTRAGLLPLIPPPREFFEPETRGSLVLAPPRQPRFGWALLLALLASAKLAAWRLLSGKRLLAEEPARN